MADGISITPGSGVTAATDDIGGFHHQRVKLSLGADGTATDALGGAGATAAGVQRVVLSTDSPGIISTGQLAKGSSLSVTMANDQEAIGYKAVAHNTALTSVTAGFAPLLMANREGFPFTICGHSNAVPKVFEFTALNTNTILLTPTAGQKSVITNLWVRAKKTVSVNVDLTIGFHTTATPVASSSGVTGILMCEQISGGDGHQIGNGGGILGIGGTDEELWITNTVPTGGAITVGFTYYFTAS